MAAILLFSVEAATASTLEPVKYATQPIAVDGDGSDPAWQQSRWRPLDKHMVGTVPAPEDFSARFKLMWDEQQLYLLVEIIDDVLIDTHPDPRDHYWDDDTLEIFVDEDASGGPHRFSNNAFAYHIALDGNNADRGFTGDEVVLHNDHVDSVWTRSEVAPYTITWEVAVRVYPDTYTHTEPGQPVTLSADKVIGFMLAYCDNDGSPQREHFMGSWEITPVNGDKNLGYLDASVFEKVKLVKP
ncbi:sugar-binding protein [Alteromonas aestuariivivens]|uniref:Sugar-binding protein n=1 Tax=Alteromonas aestuariivivens TaxID=1938339 RepID=A0A3D8MBI3_9ALTE|nr:sugar-binding protein [Alteromonas aestuariivivens]RDV26772.1 sugar-binding protein [Alteromonas aestuariivivens]